MNKELLNALKTIKKHCTEFAICEKCPLFFKNEVKTAYDGRSDAQDCVCVLEITPSSWYINEEE